jgi:hypothetical protein
LVDDVLGEVASGAGALATGEGAERCVLETDGLPAAGFATATFLAGAFEAAGLALADFDDPVLIGLMLLLPLPE